MKATFDIDERMMARLKEEAARRGTSMSELVEAALNALLDSPAPPHDLLPLPLWRGGGAHVDISNRDALSDVMEGH